MRRIICCITALIGIYTGVFSFTACNGDKGDFTVTDCVFTSFVAEDFDGNIVDETVFTGYKVTMINVWATYCAPCKSELPALAELNSEYADDGFRVIGIPADGVRQAEKARELIAETGADFVHLRVSESLKGFIASIQAVPYTIFVNENGEQLGKAYTGAKTKAEWKELVERALKAAK